MAHILFMGIYACAVRPPSPHYIGLLFTVAPDRSQAVDRFRACIEKRSRDGGRLRILDERIIEPLPGSKRFTEDHARAFMQDLQHYHFSLIDLSGNEVTEIPDHIVQLLVPCPGSFKEDPNCDEMHAHGLDCGRPDDVCILCHKPNAEHERPER